MIQYQNLNVLQSKINLRERGLGELVLKRAEVPTWTTWTKVRNGYDENVTLTNWIPRLTDLATVIVAYSLSQNVTVTPEYVAHRRFHK